MRRGYDADWIFTDAGGTDLIGITLGADFCAEHEDGIKRIREQFDMDPNAIGIEKRRVRFVPGHLHLLLNQRKTEGALVLESNADTLEKVKRFGDLAYQGTNTLATAWDEATFGILVKGPEVRYLEELHQAFLRQDVAIWLGKRGDTGPLSNSGLLIMIISKIPQANIDTLREADEDRIRLLAAAKATGIEDRIEKAGLRFFALSPRWMPDSRKTTSKYPVIFWLNPMEQDVNNSGWFSVEELDEWINGKGPVLMR